MASIDEVLKRYTSDWSELIGLPAWNAIRFRNDYINDVDKIINFVKNITHEGQDILLDFDKRRKILWLLSMDDAKELSRQMGFSNSTSPYKDISSKVGEEKLKIIFNFLKVPYPKKNIKDEIPNHELISSKYPLHDYQKNVLLRAAELYNSPNKSNFMIHMPTGSGKTRVAMSFISRVLMEANHTIVIWLAYSEELCDQAINEFKEAWSVIGDREIDIVRFYGKHEYYDINDGLIVAGLDKLRSKATKNATFISKLAAKTSLIVFDEAHQSVAPTYFQMLNSFKIFNEKCTFIGLSATPGRTEVDESFTLSQFFGKNKIKLEIEGYDSPIQYLYDEKYISIPTFYFIEYTAKSEILIDSDDLDIKQEVLKNLGHDHERNFLIIDQALSCIKKGHTRIILFAPSIDSAEFISAILNNENVKSLVVTSKTSPEMRASIINEFKSDKDEPMILCNYGILTTGFDAPKITAAIIGRPTKSLILYSQMVGRALRGSRMGGTEKADIIVMEDTKIPGIDSVIKAFEQWGKNYGWNE